MSKGIIECTNTGYKITVQREIHSVLITYVKEFVNGRLVFIQMYHEISSKLDAKTFLHLYNNLSECSMYYCKPIEGKPYGSKRIRSFKAVRTALTKNITILNGL